MSINHQKDYKYINNNKLMNFYNSIKNFGNKILFLGELVALLNSNCEFPIEPTPKPYFEYQTLEVKVNEAFNYPVKLNGPEEQLKRIVSFSLVTSIRDSLESVHLDSLKSPAGKLESNVFRNNGDLYIITRVEVADPGNLKPGEVLNIYPRVTRPGEYPVKAVGDGFLNHGVPEADPHKPGKITAK